MVVKSDFCLQGRKWYKKRKACRCEECIKKYNPTPILNYQEEYEKAIIRNTLKYDKQKLLLRLVNENNN